MASKQIKKNQVVWAKLKGYPWWPSYFTNNYQPKLRGKTNILRQGKFFSLKNIPIQCEYIIIMAKQTISKMTFVQVSAVGNNDVVVNFLGENSHATIKLDQVHDFKENYSMYNKNINERNKKLKQAVSIGMRICEGKTSFEEERKNVERQHQQETEEDEDATNQTSSEDTGRKKKNKKSGTEIQKKGKQSTDKSSIKKEDIKEIKTTGKSTQKINMEIAQNEEKNLNGVSQNGGNQKIVPENAGEPSQAASEKEQGSSKSQNYKKQQKIKEKMTHKFKQNANKLGAQNQESGADDQAETEPKKDNASIKNQKLENSGDKSPINTNQQNDASQKDDINETEEAKSEKPKKASINQNASPKLNTSGIVEEKKEILNISDSNSQQQNGQGNQQKNSIKQSQRLKRQTQKNGTSAGDISNNSNNGGESDSSRKKLKANGSQIVYQSPKDASELQIIMERIMEAFQSKKNQNIFKINEMQELDCMCDQYFKLNIPSSHFFKVNLGKVFLSILLYISSFKQTEEYNPEIKHKLEQVVENIKDKVLSETFGSEFKELVIQKKPQINGNCVQQSEGEQDEKINSSTQLNKLNSSHTKINGEAEQNAEKESEDPKKQKDQQLRKKICKKINELLKENYNLEKNKAQDLCVKLERKIKSVQPELNVEYKNNVKGLIRLLKEKEISTEKLENCEVDDLIQIISNQNILSDLKNLSAPIFDKNSSNIDQSD